MSAIQVNVNMEKVVTNNKYSNAVQLSHSGMARFPLDSHLRDMIKAANIKLVRLIDDLSSSWFHTIMPCISFDESTKTGVYDWSTADDYIGELFELGAEPLVTLGASLGRGKTTITGMILDPTTMLPNPESFASYCREWVKHYKSLGLNVRYYEIVNEPWTYFNWGPVDLAKLANYMRLFNAAAAAMRAENPDLIISFDFVGARSVTNYWLQNLGENVDSINFHKYDAWIVDQRTDDTMFNYADTQYFGQWPLGYSVMQARDVWYNARGKRLPIINSEGNFNAAWQGGCDKKNQQMAGCVWLALVIKNCILNDVSYWTYFELSGLPIEPSGSFGMINQNDDTPWFPYLLYYMVGNNLSVDDPVFNVTSDSADVEGIGWKHGDVLNVLLIHKGIGSATIQLSGTRQTLNFLKLDNATPYSNPTIQTGTVDSEAVAVSGYTVMLLQTQVIPTRKLTFRCAMQVQASVSRRETLLAKLNPGESIDLLEGTELTVAVPATVGGYTFEKWNDETHDNPKIFVLSADTTLEASYEAPILHSLFIGLGAGGRTSPESGTYQYAEGSTVPVTAIPDSDNGYKFVNWLLDGTSRTENPIPVPMDKDHTLIAVFEYVPPPPLTATITGHVKDAATDNPMPGATVTGDGYADVTEIDGLYELKDIPAATYTLTVQKEGYEPQTLSVDASSGGTFTRDVSMEPEAPPPTPTPFDTWWAGVEEFFKRLGWPVPPKPPQPPGT